jgi:hypothetical protein
MVQIGTEASDRKCVEKVPTNLKSHVKPLQEVFPTSQ